MQFTLWLIVRVLFATGRIPHELAALTELTTLDLGINNLTGLWSGEQTARQQRHVPDWQGLFVFFCSIDRTYSTTIGHPHKFTGFAPQQQSTEWWGVTSLMIYCFPPITWLLILFMWIWRHWCCCYRTYPTTIGHPHKFRGTVLQQQSIEWWVLLFWWFTAFQQWRYSCSFWSCFCDGIDMWIWRHWCCCYRTYPTTIGHPHKFTGPVPQQQSIERYVLWSGVPVVATSIREPTHENIFEFCDP